MTVWIIQATPIGKGDAEADTKQARIKALMVLSTDGRLSRHEAACTVNENVALT